MANDRESILAQARARIAELNRQRQQLTEEARRNPQAAERNRTVVTQQLGALATQIENLQRLIADGQDLASIVSALGTGNVGQVVASSIDIFLRHHNDGKLGKKTLVEVNKRATVPIFTGVGATITFYGNLEGEATVSREGNALQGQVKISGTAQLGIGFTLGFELPIIGGLSITFGIEGGPALEGTTTIRLTAADPNLSASIQPGRLELKLVTSLFADMPSVIPESLLELLNGHGGIAVRGHRLLYQIGEINIVTATTPTYAITLNTNNWSFSGGRASGEYSFRINPVVQQRVEAIKQAIINAANSIANRVLHPFS